MVDVPQDRLSAICQQNASPWSFGETPSHNPAWQSKLESDSPADGQDLWSPSSLNSQASFDALAGFLCLAEAPESSVSEQTASCSFLESSRRLWPDERGSARSSLDSDRTSFSEPSQPQAVQLHPRQNAHGQPFLQQCCHRPPTNLSSPHVSLRLDHEDVLSAWHKLSGGRAAFCNQQLSSSSSAATAHPPDGSSSFVPVVPQERAQAAGQPSLLTADPIRLLQSGMPQLPEQSSVSAATSSLSGAACGSHSCCDQDMGLGSRQARLDRYREKKRTRGFSSKIRYEMRKINAERRPRVKGRFVKREGMTEVDEALDESLDPLLDYDPMDFCMIDPLDISGGSLLT